MRKEMWASHRITAFQVLGKEKALTVFPPTLVWFLSGQPDKLPMGDFLRCGPHHALSFFFTSLHYSTYCLGRLATLCDIVRQLSGVDSRWTGDYRQSRGRNKHSIQDGLFGTQRKTVERAKGSSPKDRSEPSSLTLPL